MTGFRSRGHGKNRRVYPVRSGKVRKKPSIPRSSLGTEYAVEGQYEGEGSGPLGAIDTILRIFEPDDSTDVEFFEPNGSTLGPPSRGEMSCEAMGQCEFSCTVYKYGRYYSVAGHVSKNRRGKLWTAGAEVEEVEPA